MVKMFKLKDPKEELSKLIVRIGEQIADMADNISSDINGTTEIQICTFIKHDLTAEITVTKKISSEARKWQNKAENG